MAQQTNQENDAEKLVRDYQMVQEQLRSTAMQLEQLQVQSAEFDKAKAEISSATGKVYITVGGVIVETNKEKALADIKDKSELSAVRITSLSKQLESFKTKEKQLGEKITQMYKQSQGPG